MRFPKILLVTAVAACLTTTAAFSAPSASNPSNSSITQQKSDTLNKDKKNLDGKKHRHKFDEAMQKDPIKALEGRKEEVKSLLKDGKITKEKADTINARIDSKIKAIQEFNKLSVQQKKEKLKSDYKVFLEKRSKEGRITQDKMNELIKTHGEKVDKWDGTGYPRFLYKEFKTHDRAGVNDKK